MGLDNESADERSVAAPLELLRENLPDAVLETSLPQGDATAVVRPEALLRVMEFLKGDPRLGFNVLIDITAVDRIGRTPRFDVVYHLLSLACNRRLRVKVFIGEEDAVASLCGLWGSANWLEREVWDMFGIRFTGHPDLKRILLYEEFQGHPLRKDYPIRKRQPLIGPKN